jgi:hypothetical protein
LGRRDPGEINLISLSFQESHQVGRKARLNVALNSKCQKEIAGKASVGVAALLGAVSNVML